MNRRLLVIIIAAPLIVGLAIILYAWPSARTQPRHVPVGLAATGTQADVLTGKLTSEHGMFTVRRYADAGSVRNAIRHRDIDAGLVVTGSGSHLYTASAAGPALQQAIVPVLRSVGGTKTAPIDLVPTPPADPMGSVLGQAVLPLTLAGQLSAIMLALAVRPGWRQLVPLVVISAATGLLGVAVVGGWLAALGSGAWWLEAAAFAVTVLAVGSIVLGLHALAGRLGLPLAFALLVFLGNAFSGASSAPELLPDAVHRVGQWLPPGAGSELLRSVAFFHGHGSVHPVVVLAIWIVGGFAAVAVGSALAERRLTSGRHERDRSAAVTAPVAG